jgi:hypothetical protein
VLRTEKFAGGMGPPASTLKGVRMRDFDLQTMRRDARTLLDAAFRLPLSRLPHQSRRHGPLVDREATLLLDELDPTVPRPAGIIVVRGYGSARP